MGFAGQYRMHTENQLIYLRARTYDPVTAQFLSVDPMVAVTGARYSYASDNPANLGDPSGLVGEELCDEGLTPGNMPTGTQDPYPEAGSETPNLEAEVDDPTGDLLKALLDMTKESVLGLTRGERIDPANLAKSFYQSIGEASFERVRSWFEEHDYLGAVNAMSYIKAIYDGVQTGVTWVSVYEAFEELQESGGAAAIAVMVAGIPLGF